jgi:hypothetical protein
MGSLWISPIFYAKQAFHGNKNNLFLIFYNKMGRTHGPLFSADFDLQMLFVATFGPGVGKLQCVLHYFDRLSESGYYHYFILFYFIIIKII